jgi:hypothetical protein
LTPTTPVHPPETIRKPMVALVSLSIVIALFLIWLIYFKGKEAAPDWVGALPAANASFNSLSALCLTFGYINIRSGNKLEPNTTMLDGHWKTTAKHMAASKARPVFTRDWRFNFHRSAMLPLSAPIHSVPSSNATRLKLVPVSVCSMSKQTAGQSASLALACGRARWNLCLSALRPDTGV